MPYDFKRLKAGRERLGITQTELARRMGVTNQAVNYIEKGVRNSPGLCTLYADLVGIPVDDVVISDEEFERLQRKASNGKRSRKELAGNHK